LGGGGRTTTLIAVTLRASVPLGIGRLLAGPARPATVLGRFPTALYTRLPDGEVVALLTRDAVRVPCGLVLARSSAELRLDVLEGPVSVGDGALRVGGLEVWPGRIVSLSVPRLPRPTGHAVEQAAAEIGAFDGCSPEGLADPARAAGAARRLLGRGSGLTPSGDDLLAGFLVGCAAYGRPAGDVRGVVLDEGRRTTDLSAALLRHAARGEALPEVTRLLVAMSEGRGIATAAAELVRVGHTSGTALAIGAVAAARTNRGEQ